MQQKSVWIISIAAIVAVVAVTAVVFGPGNFAGLGGPRTPDGGTGNEPGADSPIAAPTWHEGDTWTYEIGESSRMVADVYPAPSGRMTKTVVSADETKYNVTIEGPFLTPRRIDPTRFWPSIVGDLPGYRPLFENATVEGYAWYRTSDLAKLMDVRTIEIKHSFETDAGMHEGSYVARVETTYDPALDVWSFPLDENETWTAATNATTRAWITYRFLGPDFRLEKEYYYNLTKPIRIALSSGFAEDVVTPAGTFTSIPVHVGVSPSIQLPDQTEEFLLDIGNAEAFEHRVSVTIWFSGTAKNVVMASVTLGGHRTDAVLVSYDVG